jgi:hypothetical protein
VKRRVFLLPTLALVGDVAFAAGSVASAKPALAEGLAAYPGGPSSRCGYASRAPTLPARWSAPRTTP